MNTRRKGLRYLAILGVFALILAACAEPEVVEPEPEPEPEPVVEPEPEPEPEPVEEVSPDEETTELIRYGTQRITSEAAFWVGMDKGIFEEQGLKVEPEIMVATPEVITQVAAGHLDLGAVTMSAGQFNAIDRGLDFKVVAGNAWNGERPQNPLMVRTALIEDGSVAGVADLRGRRIALTSLGSATEYYLDRVLRSDGLTIEDVEVVTMGLGDMPAALDSGSIDAAVIFEALATRTEQEGIAQRIGEDAIANVQVTFIIANGRFIEERTDDLVSFLRGHLLAMRTQHGDAYYEPENLALLEEITDIPQEILRIAVPTFFEPNGRVDLDEMMNVQEYFFARGNLDYDELMPIEAVVNLDYLAQALNDVGEFDAN